MGASGCGKVRKTHTQIIRWIPLHFLIFFTCLQTTLLSCIIGMIPLDGGEIHALGEKTVANKIQKAGPRIGYMPQETALIGELSVKETIYYFGKIFQINDEKLRERYKMLRNLLELPRDEHRVEDCSGGQQRRVSFAAAMIHEPDLLILDGERFLICLRELSNEQNFCFLLLQSQLSVSIRFSERRFGTLCCMLHEPADSRSSLRHIISKKQSKLIAVV